MVKRVSCQKCAQVFDQQLPDVSPFEAVQLQAAGDDRGVIFECPICKEKNWLPRWDLPGLSDPPSTSGH